MIQSKKVALWAYPSKHSLSPRMHQACYEAFGLGYRYLAEEVIAEELTLKLNAMRLGKWQAANISMPYKQSVLPFLDALTKESARIGAVNTIVRTQEGHLVGYNTDGDGARSFLESQGHTLQNSIVVILGAGGTGRALAIAMATSGTKTVYLCNRQGPGFMAAKQWLDTLPKWYPISLLAFEDAHFSHTVMAADVILQATSLGMVQTMDRSPLALSDFSPHHIVMDCVYEPRETRFLKEARQAGVRYSYNGLGMLIHQGALAFLLQTGSDYPLDVVVSTMASSIKEMGDT